MELAQSPLALKRKVDRDLFIWLVLLAGLIAWGRPELNQLMGLGILLFFGVGYWLVLRVPLSGVATSALAEGTRLTVVTGERTHRVEEHQLRGARYNPGIKGHPDRIFLSFDSMEGERHVVFVPSSDFRSAWRATPVGQRLLELSGLGG